MLRIVSIWMYIILCKYIVLAMHILDTRYLLVYNKQTLSLGTLS